jgi:hypothetical protein
MTTAESQEWRHSLSASERFDNIERMKVQYLPALGCWSNKLAERHPCKRQGPKLRRRRHPSPSCSRAAHTMRAIAESVDGPPRVPSHSPLTLKAGPV